MADLATISAALIRADALAQQGDKQAIADAKVLADAYRSMKAAPVEAPAAPDYRGDGLAGTGLGAAITGAAQGVSFGTADEMKAALRATGDAIGNPFKGGDGQPWGDSYDRRLTQERNVLSQMRTEDPVATYGGEIAGALMLPGATMKAGATTGANALRMGLSGAAQGTAYGFGAGEGGAMSRARSAGAGGLVGGATGAAAPFVLKGAQKVGSHFANAKAMNAAADAAPTVDDLRAQASALYSSAKGKGVVVKESAFTPLVDDVLDSARQMGADQDLTPKAWAAMRRLNETKGGPIGWQDLETLRKVTSIASTAKDPADRRVAGAIVQKVDDFVLNLVDGDLDAGTAAGLGAELKEARTLWGKMRRSERLAGAMETAKDAASGYENGLRIEFRKLIKDQKFFRGLTDGEQAAIRAVVRGTPVGNTLKRVSRLSFGHGAQTNVLGGMVGSGLGAAAGNAVAGPIGAAAGAALTAGAGHLAGNLSEQATESLARRAGAITAGGGVMLPAPVQYPMVSNALTRAPAPAGVAGVNWWNR